MQIVCTFFSSFLTMPPTVWFLDHVSGISIRDDPQESKENIESELDVYTLPGSWPPQDNNVMAHGNSLTSKLDLSGPLDLDKPLWSVFYILWMLVTKWNCGKSVDWCFHLNWTPPFFWIQIIYRDDHLPHEILTTHFDRSSDTEVLLCISIHKFYLNQQLLVILIHFTYFDYADSQSAKRKWDKSSQVHAGSNYLKISFLVYMLIKLTIFCLEYL